MPNPRKILEHSWDNFEDMLEMQVPKCSQDQPITKRGILSHLGSIYDPLGIISPTVVKEKWIYRDACDNQEWNREGWLKWTHQL